MEPRGCNQWLLVANRPGLKTAKASQNRCRVVTFKNLYLCTVPGHAQAGMKGTFTVR